MLTYCFRLRVWVCRVVAALVGVFEVIPAVHASHAAFVVFDGERVAVVGGGGGGVLGRR